MWRGFRERFSIGIEQRLRKGARAERKCEEAKASFVVVFNESRRRVETREATLRRRLQSMGCDYSYGGFDTVAGYVNDFDTDFLVSSAVAEFKGSVIFGVVRLAQVNMELSRIEASFSGLSPGKHGWSINEYGDLTRGAASTGKTFNPANHLSEEKPLGDLGTLEAAENGEAHFSGSKEKLRVSDLIGRSIVVYEKEDKSDSGIAAAVIARSAGVGENYKKICTCDGVTIWESS